MSVVDINRVPDVNGKVPAKQESPVYEQLTISDWLAMKEKLRLELQNVTQSFVRIGYALRKIDDEKMYETDGYKSIAEFAKKEYGLEASTVSRLMAINREYSIDGYSERLRPEYNGIGQSKLSEMLQLPEEDRELITPQTQRSDIRELKEFNRTAPEEGEADDIRSLIEAYFRQNREDLNTLYGMQEDNHVADSRIEINDLRAVIDLLNPSGSKVFKKGLYMLFLYEENVKIKKFGENPVTHTWGDFLAAVDDIFGPAAAGYHTWERYFGEEPKEEIAPAQKTAQASEENTQEQVKNDQNTQEGVHDEQEDDQEDPEAMEREAQDQEMAAAGEEPEADLSEAMNPPEKIAPAQNSVPAAAEEKAEPAAADPRYQKGEKVLIEGEIEMVTVGSNGVVNYRIRSKGGKTMWIIEEDIVEETI